MNLIDSMLEILEEILEEFGLKNQPKSINLKNTDSLEKSSIYELRGEQLYKNKGGSINFWAVKGFSSIADENKGALLLQYLLEGRIGKNELIEQSSLMSYEEILAKYGKIKISERKVTFKAVIFLETIPNDKLIYAEDLGCTFDDAKEAKNEQIMKLMLQSALANSEVEAVKLMPVLNHSIKNYGYPPSLKSDYTDNEQLYYI